MKRSLRFQIPIFVAIRTALNTTVRMVYPFLPVFGRALGVDLWMISSAVSVRNLSGLASPFLSSIADTRGRKTGMLLGMVLFTLGVALMAVLPTFPILVITLVLTMVGNNVFIPSLQAYLGDRVEYQKRGLALGLTELSWSLAFIIGVPLVGYLISRFGLRMPFAVLSVIGMLAITGLQWMLSPDTPQPGSTPSIWHHFRVVFTSVPAIAGVVIGFSMIASNELLNVVFGVWLEDAFNVKIAALSAASVVIGASELAGVILGTGLADRIGKVRSVATGILVNCGAIFLLSVFGTNMVVAFIGLFLVYISIEFVIVSNIPLMTELLPAARATLMGVYLAGESLGSGLAALLAPRLYLLDSPLGNTTRLFWIGAGSIMLNLIAISALYVLNRTRG